MGKSEQSIDFENECIRLIVYQNKVSYRSAFEFTINWVNDSIDLCDRTTLFFCLLAAITNAIEKVQNETNNLFRSQWNVFN